MRKEIDGVQKLIKAGLRVICDKDGAKKLGFNDCDFDGSKIVGNDDAKATVTVNESFNIAKFINIGKLKHLDTTAKWGVITDENMFFNDKGEVLPIRDVFSGIKVSLNAKKKFNVGDIVCLDKLTIGNVVFTITSAYSISDENLLNGKLVGVIYKIMPDNKYSVKIQNISVDVHGATITKINSKDIGKCMIPFIKFALENKCNISFDSNLNYMRVSDCGGFVNYIAKDRLERFNGDFWNEELRNKLGTKRKIRSVLINMLGMPQDVAEIALSMYGKSDVGVQILEGDDVKLVFKRENIVDRGNIGASCMIDKPQNYFNIYADNAKCAIIRDSSGKIMARALVWTAKHDKNKNIKLMDRIYCSDDKLIPVMQIWAKKNGYHHLKEQSHSGHRAVCPKGNEISLAGYFITADKQYSYYPYMDTFYVNLGARFYCRKSLNSTHSTGGRLEAM